MNKYFWSHNLLFKPSLTMSNLLISLFSLVFSLKDVARLNLLYWCESHIWHWVTPALEVLPHRLSGPLVAVLHHWVPVFWTPLPHVHHVSPTYWWIGHKSVPFWQVTMYSRFELLQVNFSLTASSSPLLLTMTVFYILILYWFHIVGWCLTTITFTG